MFHTLMEHAKPYNRLLASLRTKKDSPTQKVSELGKPMA